MALPLKQSHAVSDLAEHLCAYLPGSGNRAWTNHVNFHTVAEKVGVGRFWQPGSKLPMIVALLERTLEFERALFEPLILEIVRAGITYRQKQGNPVCQKDIDQLNGLLIDIGFKFPALWDPDFHAMLRMDGASRAKEHVSQAISEEKARATTTMRRAAQLAELEQHFYALHGQSNRQAAGLALEGILNRLFALYGLAPREPFRVVGEQIDGSFDLDEETYLLEAKWEKDPLPEAPLLVFREKIAGKSSYTRGMFVSLNGVTAEARQSIVVGKQPNFFIVDGHDLTMMLRGQTELLHFLRQRRRLLAEEGCVVVPFAELVRRSKRF